MTQTQTQTQTMIPAAMATVPRIEVSLRPAPVRGGIVGRKPASMAEVAGMFA